MGRSVVEDRLLQIVDRLQPMQPRRILLFGSAARGEADTDSDLDIIVVAEGVARTFLDRMGEARRLIQPTYGLDVLVYTPQEYSALLAEGNTFLEDAEREGRVLFGAWSPDVRAVSGVRRRPREAARWLAMAEADLRAARLLIDEVPSMSCFHAQQSVEKALKALLLAAGERPGRSHVIKELGAAALVHDEGYGDVHEEATKLDEFYMSARYPNGVDDRIDPDVVFDADAARAAVATAAVVLERASRFLEEQAGTSEPGS